MTLRIPLTLVAAAALCLTAGPARAGALHFTRATDSVQIAGSSPTTSGTSTWEFEVYFDSADVSNGIVYHTQRNGYEDKQIFVGPNAVGFGFYWSAGLSVGRPGLFSIGAWHHVAYVRDAGSALPQRLYIDGVLVASSTSAGAIQNNPGAPQYLGYNSGVFYWGPGFVQYALSGTLGAFRISDVARYSGSSTTAANFAVPSGDLSTDANTQLLYNFNEVDCGDSDTIADLSGNGYTGTMGAMPDGTATEPTLGNKTPPTITCSQPETLECVNGGAAGSPSASASDVCGAAVSATCSSGAQTYPVGTTDVSCSATDSWGNQSSCQTSVTVVDTLPPSITLVAQPLEVASPHQAGNTVTVSLADCVASAADQCDGALDPNAAGAITAIEQLEPSASQGNAKNGCGPGAIAQASATSATLRADGHLYRIDFTVTDAAGHAAASSCVVKAGPGQDDDHGNSPSDAAACACCIGSGCGTCPAPK